MKTSKLLKLTRDEFLWDGHGCYPGYRARKPSHICFALAEAAFNVGTASADCAARKITNVISDRLGSSPTLHHWLRNKKHIPLCDLEDTVKLQVTRVAWMNSLIAEYKAKGD